MTHTETASQVTADAPAQNGDLLQRVKRHITEDPRRLDLSVWTRPSNAASGGWCACIGAWAAILSGQYRPGPSGLVTPDDDAEVMHEWGACQQVLGITEEMAERLFIVDGWPHVYADRYRRWPEERAQVAAERINHFIATNGAE